MRNLLTIIFTLVFVNCFAQFYPAELKLDSIANDTAYISFEEAWSTEWVDSIVSVYYIQSQSAIMQHYEVDGSSTKIPLKYCNSVITRSSTIWYENCCAVTVASNSLYVDLPLNYTYDIKTAGYKKFQVDIDGNWDYAEIRVISSTSNQPYLLMVGNFQYSVVTVKPNHPNPLLDKSMKKYSIYVPYLVTRWPHRVIVTFYKNGCIQSVFRQWQWG